ncbi:MAG: hypothetical protein IJ833_04365 [Lachnospiraceae bacterium]|nr:hypothetical protein [Lachnospiraceae bacterium]
MYNDLKLMVSPVCSKDGKTYAFVSFSDEERYAEGRIPECTMISNQGFTENEVAQLERYMREHLAELKQTAAGINPLGAFMKE